MSETVEITETVETLETTEKWNPSETSDKVESSDKHAASMHPPGPFKEPAYGHSDNAIGSREVSSQRQHTTETTRTRYLQVFAGVTGFFAEHTVSRKMLDLLGNRKARNENPTHSHLTTRAEAASYLTTKTLLIDDQDREDVKTLADARASPKQITSFPNKRIGEESEFGKKEAGKNHSTANT
ncbi:hypothetical protein PI126_g23142 [Phytophthora idaei]|nr:hypothetical protein PI126_g23142 [Phytophthora idaei]